MEPTIFENIKILAVLTENYCPKPNKNNNNAKNLAFLNQVKL